MSTPLRDIKLQRVESATAPSTQLVSLYVPSSKRLSDVVSRLRSEKSEAENIKSKSTRTNVQRGLDLVLSQLTDIGHVPENGLVVFGGVGSEGEEYQSAFYEFESPIESYRYHCGKEFLTEPLRKALDDRHTFGLIVAERREGTVGRLVGNSIEEIRTVESGAKGKHSAGGFSQGRFEKLEEEATQNFFDKLTETAVDSLDLDEIEGVLVGGTSITVDKFTSQLPAELSDNVIGTYSVEYAGESGLKELVDKGADQIDDVRVSEAKNAVEEFFSRLHGDSGRVEYGFGPTSRAAEFGAIDTLLISDKWHPDNAKIEQLVEATKEKGGSVIPVPETFEKGEQFAGAFDGIGALLRYEVGSP